MTQPCTSPGRLVLLTLIFLMAPFASCVVTDVGNPPDKPTLTVKLALQFEVAAGTSPSFSLDRAWFSFKRIRVIEASDCTDDAAVDVPIAPPFELLAWSTPSLPLVISQESDEFCRVGMVFDPIAASTLPKGAPVSAIGASLVLTGIIPDTQGRRVTIALDLTGKLKLDVTGEGPLKLDARQRIHELLISVDIERWVTATSLRAADADAQGNVQINATQNRAMYDQILEELGDHVSLFYDKNGDGEFDDEDRVEPVATGGMVKEENR